MSRRVLGALVAAGAALVSWGAVSQPRASSEPVRPVHPRGLAVLTGFAPAPVGSTGHYELRHRRAGALFDETGLSVRLPSHLQQERELGWRVAGARAVRPQAENPRAPKLNRLVGPQGAWERDVPTYGGLRYPGVLPGVDLWFEERAEGLEYGFRAERGADLRRVRLEYAGAREVRVVEAGRALEVDLGEGVLREQGLRCVQEGAEGLSSEVGCRFTDARAVGPERWEYAIEVDVVDPERPVVVDPLVLWNTYLGSPEDDYLMDIEQDGSGNVFIVGTVSATPTSPPSAGGALGGPGGDWDVLVARFQRDGGLSWSTLLGGSGRETGMALAVGATGEVYVAGGTNSTDFKGTASDGGVGSALQGPSDGFVARLSSSGKSLDWLLFVGGTREDELMNMLQGPSGELFVIGQTKSEDLPARVGALDPLNGWEGFAAHINPSVPGTAWSAYIQGPDDQAMSDLAFDPGSSGILYVTGTRLQGTAAQDAFLGTISGATSGATRLQSLIPVGGSGRDEGHALVLAPSEVQVWGTTWSNDFPMAGASQAGDVFVAVFPEWLSNPSMPLEKAALFGGPEDDELRSATMDSAGHIYVGGVTTSRRFPVPGGFDTDMGSGDFVDGFVARVRLDAKPASVEWGSFVGGSQYDEVLVVRADNQEPDRLFIGGYTGSDDLRYSPSGYNPKQSNGGYDMFLLSVDVKALPDGGTAEPDAGSEVPDAGPGEPDAGTGQPDAGAGAPDAGTEGPRSPLGWSCGATDGRGGPGALSVVMLTGLGLFVSRRQRQEGSVITIPGRR